MATTAKALGAVGCVSDGDLRDIAEIRQIGGFQLFCPGFVIPHGYKDCRQPSDFASGQGAHLPGKNEVALAAEGYRA